MLLDVGMGTELSLEDMLHRSFTVLDGATVAHPNNSNNCICPNNSFQIK